MTHDKYINRMTTKFLLILLLSVCNISSFADDYNARQAKWHMREAEYYQKKAEGHRKEAQYFLKKAEDYQREAAYYIRKGDADRTKDYNRRAERAIDDYKTQLSYAKKADETAADHMRKANNALRK